MTHDDYYRHSSQLYIVVEVGFINTVIIYIVDDEYMMKEFECTIYLFIYVYEIIRA